MRNAAAGRNGTSRVAVWRRVLVRQATAAVLVAAPVAALVLVAVLSEPWKPSGEAHPLLVVAFMAAVGVAGLAGMMLMRRRSRRGLQGPRGTPSRPDGRTRVTTVRRRGSVSAR